MAEKKTKDAKTASKTTLAELLEAKGVEMSEQKTKLWSEPDMVKENVKPTFFESMRVSTEYENSVYAIYREGGKSKLISFARDEVDIDDLVFDEESGKIDIEESGLEDQTFSIGVVTALRDDDDFGIAEGDVKAKLYVE